jgi:hypothetical protein
MRSIAKVSEVNAAIIFKVDREDGIRAYLRNTGNITDIRMVQILISRITHQELTIPNVYEYKAVILKPVTENREFPG